MKAVPIPGSPPTISTPSSGSSKKAASKESAKAAAPESSSLPISSSGSTSPSPSTSSLTFAAKWSLNSLKSCSASTLNSQFADFTRSKENYWSSLTEKEKDRYVVSFQLRHHHISKSTTLPTDIPRNGKTTSKTLTRLPPPPSPHPPPNSNIQPPPPLPPLPFAAESFTHHIQALSNKR